MRYRRDSRPSMTPGCFQMISGKAAGWQGAGLSTRSGGMISSKSCAFAGTGLLSGYSDDERRKARASSERQMACRSGWPAALSPGCPPQALHSRCILRNRNRIMRCSTTRAKGGACASWYASGGRAFVWFDKRGLQAWRSFRRCVQSEFIFNCSDSGRHCRHYER